MNKLLLRVAGIALFSLLAGYHLQAQQNFATYVGLGLGRHFEQAFPYGKRVSNGRVAISVSQYARLSTRYSIGLFAMASGRLSALLGGAPPGDFYDPNSNTVIINYNNLSAATYLLKNKFDCVKKEGFVVYADVGLGISRYQYVQVNQSAFSFVPEIGIAKDAFKCSASFIWGGRTPSFTTVSVVPNSTALTSIRSNRLYISLSYRLFNF